MILGLVMHKGFQYCPTHIILIRDLIYRKILRRNLTAWRQTRSCRLKLYLLPYLLMVNRTLSCCSYSTSKTPETKVCNTISTCNLFYYDRQVFHSFRYVKPLDKNELIIRS